MPGKIALVTDSTANLPEDIRAQYNVHVIPTMLHWGSQSYRDGVDISPHAFFERLKTDPIHPTTSAFSIGSAQEIYRQAAEGHAGVLGIHLSSLLSGVFGVAVQARDLMPDLNLRLVDSRATTMAMGYIIQAAGEALQAGASLEEAAALAERLTASVGVILTPEVLTYLQRGGRIKAAQALVGGLLDLKPIIDLQSGALVPIERVRSRKKAVARVVDLASERLMGKPKVRLAGIHAAAEADARAALETLSGRLGANVIQSVISDVSPTVGAHTGPGTIGVAFSYGF